MADDDYWYDIGLPVFNITNLPFLNVSVPLPPSLVPESFTARAFKEINLVDAMHNAPRWGNSRDAALLVQGSDSEQQSYKMGLFATAILMWCIMGVWGFAIIYTYRKRRFGWLAGLPPEKPSSDMLTSRSARKGEATEREGIDEWNEDEAPRKASGAEKSTMTVSSVSSREGQPPSKKRVAATGDPAPSSSSSVSSTSNKSASKVRVESAVAVEVLVENDAEKPPHMPQQSTAPKPFTAESDDPKNLDVESDQAESDQALIEWTEEVRRAKRRMRICRWLVLISGVVFIVTSGFLIKYGVRSLDDTVNSALVTLPPLTEAVQTANNATTDYLVASNETRDARIEFINQLEFCPDLWDKLNISNYTNITVEDIQYAINFALNLSFDLKHHYIGGVDEILYNVTQILEDVESALYTVDDWGVIALVIVIIVLDIMVFMFMVGVILAWNDKQPRLFRDMSTRVVLPIFVFLVILLSVICPYMLIFSQFMGDFCVNTPDDQVVRMINAPRAYTRLVDFYVRGCNEEDTPIVFFLIFGQFWWALNALNEVIDVVLSSPVIGIYQPCKDWDSFKTALAIFQNSLEALIDSLDRIFETMQCTNFNPIYTGLAYETGCEYGLRATGRMFGFLIVMKVCSMIIITLRVAWFELEEKADQEESEEISVASDSDLEKEEEETQATTSASRCLGFISRFFGEK